MSKVEVNEVAQQTGTTLTVGGGSGKTVKVCGTTVTMGRCGGTVTLASGATQSGFGRTGTVDWCTTAKTSPLTAVSGKGYMINTCGGAVTVTLPSSPSAGDIVSLKDYKNTWGVACKAVTLGRGGSKLAGNCLDATLETEGQSVTMVYIDGTQGWLNVQTDTTVAGEAFVAASGGNTTITCGNYKVHIFTGDGCFQVTNAGASSGSNTVSYLVVAGGGGGGYYYGAGGAGGYREGKATSDSFTQSPIGATSGIPVSVQTYPITVGGGGAGASGSGTPPVSVGTSGSNSIASTITSAGGGGGAGVCAGAPASAGGSGGSGGYVPHSVGAGNTPPVSPPQGNAGGSSNPNGGGGGGGGGALVAGANAPSSAGHNGLGGNGANIGTNFFGPTSGSYGTPGSNPGRYFAGGGTGSWCGSPAGTDAGGEGGGGVGKGALPAVGSNPGTTNTGGGGGGGGGPGGTSAGGSGFVAIRYKFQ